MILRGFDRVGDVQGLHYGTVLTACRIVSGRHDGFLTVNKGDEALRMQFDDLLHEGYYYFTVPNDVCYAVYPNFAHWPFPHGNLPATWTKLRKKRTNLRPMPAQSFTAQAIIDRDPTCLISGYGDVRERAHICPRKEAVWYQINNMRRYNLNHKLAAEARIDDMSNGTAMRSDIHTAYDVPFFTIVPKNDRWSVHFTEPTFHLGSLYHNMEVDLDPDIGLENMYSRFAWTIFPLIREFLEQGPPRHVRIRVSTNDGYREQIKKLQGGAISDTIFPRARSESPKKRKMGKNDDGGGKVDQDVEMAICSGDGELNLDEDSSEEYSRDESDPSQATSTSTSLSSSSIYPDDNSSGTITPSDHCPKIEEYCFGVADVMDEDPRVQQFYADEDDFERTRRRAIERGRPRHNPRLYCCDYDQNREAFWAAVKGEGRWDAYQLCEKCLGTDHLAVAEDLDD